MTQNSKTITLSGLQIRYTESGQGSPVLLIHSLGASTVTWRDNIRPLAERHRVFAIDLPGHGDSDKPDISYDAPSMVNLIAEFVSALGLEKVALVGNSIGGGLCLLTALERPQIVSRLVLISSGGLGRNIGMFLRFASIPWLGRILASRPRGSARAILPIVFHDKSFATEDLINELDRAATLPGAGNAHLRITANYISLFGVRRRYIFTRRLKELQMPVIIFWGAGDRIIPVRHAHRAARSLPRADLHIFGNSGHWPHMERAADFNRLTLEFLSRPPEP